MQRVFILLITLCLFRQSYSQLSKEKEISNKELEVENKKNIQTLDIDHFWGAFDNLKKCKTFGDSVQSFQQLYIDRATDGFKDFLMVRNFTAKEYVKTVTQFPKFYQSIRVNTYKAKKAAPLIQDIFNHFKKIYPNFKPFKVCFAIGTIRTGGTVSNKFVLIGAEITTATKNNDLSELKGTLMGNILAKEDNVLQNIKNMIAHECVHTQQINSLDAKAEKCDLLYKCMIEGFCDFIGELIAGGQINAVAQQYGNSHEKRLWNEFSKEMCSNSTEHWLYNYRQQQKDNRPADLGYYIGYKIAKSYYNEQANKKQAIIDIIEMNNPKPFLAKSKYAEKLKK